jgi:hypothetical protein
MIRCQCHCVCCDTQIFVLRDAREAAHLTCPSCGRHLQAQQIDPFGEAEWQTCSDPFVLAAFRHGWPSDRKCRLYACACCRLVWNELDDPRSRAAVEVAERLADGLASPAEVARAREEAEAVTATYVSDWHPAVAAEAALGDRPPARLVIRAVLPRGLEQHGERKAQVAALFRDIAGNPFRPSPPISPTVRAWNDGTVVQLARGIYEERAFDRLPILADALEDAGCTDTDLVAHCRAPGPHVRGCWAVDFLLSKE